MMKLMKINKTNNTIKFNIELTKLIFNLTYINKTKNKK